MPAATLFTRRMIPGLLAAGLAGALVGCSPDRSDVKIFNRTGEDLILVARNGKRFDWPAGTEFNLSRRDFLSEFQNPEQPGEGTTTYLTLQRGDATYRYTVKLYLGTRGYIKQEGDKGLRVYSFRRILDADFRIYEADAHDTDYASRSYPQGEHYPVTPAPVTGASPP